MCLNDRPPNWFIIKDPEELALTIVSVSQDPVTQLDPEAPVSSCGGSGSWTPHRIQLCSVSEDKAKKEELGWSPGNAVHASAYSLSDSSPQVSPGGGSKMGSSGWSSRNLYFASKANLRAQPSPALGLEWFPWFPGVGGASRKHGASGLPHSCDPGAETCL